MKFRTCEKLDRTITQPLTKTQHCRNVTDFKEKPLYYPPNDPKKEGNPAPNILRNS